MTEKSPASGVHSTEPVSASFDGSDAAPAASNITDDEHQPPQSDETDATDRDASTSQPDVSPAAESSPQSSNPLESSTVETGHELDKLKLSTLKELTVVSHILSLIYTVFRKKQPLTFFFISPRKMFRFAQNFQCMFMRN